MNFELAVISVSTINTLSFRTRHFAISTQFMTSIHLSMYFSCHYFVAIASWNSPNFSKKYVRYSSPIAISSNTFSIPTSCCASENMV